MSIRTTLIAVAAVAAGLASTLAAVSPAMAAASSIEVSYDDLNLDTEAGRASFDGRIAYAARQLCGDYSHLELKFAAQSRECQADVIAAARAQRDAIVGGERFASLRLSRAAS